MVDPFQDEFSAFVFKIQANMNKNHRDRIAFMRICSGKFTAGMEVYPCPGWQADQTCAAAADDGRGAQISLKRRMPEILSVFLIRAFFPLEIPLPLQKKNSAFEGIPTFAPEHFARVRQIDTMKRKQFVKGITPDRTGRCNSDFPGIQYRHGRDHCWCCRCTAV